MNKGIVTLWNIGKLAINEPNKGVWVGMQKEFKANTKQKRKKKRKFTLNSRTRFMYGFFSARNHLFVLGARLLP